MSANVESMAYANAKPWHGLGTPVDESITPEEMVEKAGLNWAVATAPLKYDVPMGFRVRTREAPKQRALYRTDTGDLLDVVGHEWNPVQNTEVLEFFREYVEAGDATLETAGSLDDGRMVWALAKLRASFTLDGDDRVEGYVLLANPHQYRKALTVKVTNIRVVCWNTITAALRGAGREVRLSHRKPFTESVRQEAKRNLGIAREKVDAFAGVADRLSRLTLDQEDAAKLAGEILGVEDPLESLERPRGSYNLRHVLDLYNGDGAGSRLPSAQDTGWGLLNAVTEWQDHYQGHNQNNRLKTSWFGRGETLKRRAMDHLLEVAPK